MSVLNYKGCSGEGKGNQSWNVLCCFKSSPLSSGAMIEDVILLLKFSFSVSPSLNPCVSVCVHVFGRGGGGGCARCSRPDVPTRKIISDSFDFVGTSGWPL